MKMFEYLKQLQEEFALLQRMLTDDKVISDQKRYRETTVRYAALNKIIPHAIQLDRLMASKEEIMQVLASESDEEMLLLAGEELPVTEAKIEKVKSVLEQVLFEEESDPDRDIFVEIRPAAGGQESALFAAELYRMYVKYADEHGWKVDVVEEQNTEIGGLKSVVFGVSGHGASLRFKYESGVHRVQRVPETESGGRIHTSTVTVAVMVEPDEVDVTIDPSELKIDTYRASGAGGQHVNTTDSAVRITHVPTGIIVACQDERSQVKNKEKAMRLLRTKIHDKMLEDQQQDVADQRRAQIGTGDRSEKIRTYNYPQRRVTDHRGPVTVYRLEEILEGNLDFIVEELMDAERKLKIQW